MDERLAFEEWLLTTFELDDEWDEDRNCYKHFACHLAWHAWKARSALSATDPNTSGASD